MECINIDILPITFNANSNYTQCPKNRTGGWNSVQPGSITRFVPAKPWVKNNKNPKSKYFKIITGGSNWYNHWILAGFFLPVDGFDLTRQWRYSSGQT